MSSGLRLSWATMAMRLRENILRESMGGDWVNSQGIKVKGFGGAKNLLQLPQALAWGLGVSNQPQVLQS